MPSRSRRVTPLVLAGAAAAAGVAFARSRRGGRPTGGKTMPASPPKPTGGKTMPADDPQN